MATIHIDETRPLGTIAPEIYGHFSEHLGRCIYEGIFVKPDSGIPNVNGMRTDVVEALREIRVPVLRWPGGCFADEYHWKDGIGPLESRKRMVNTHWGGVVEDDDIHIWGFPYQCIPEDPIPWHHEMSGRRSEDAGRKYFWREHADLPRGYSVWNPWG